MRETWRLLELDVYDAYTNMAIDEALMRLRSEGRSQNTLRFYRWKPSAVSIGYFQILEKEVNVDSCRRRGVDIIRRMTGGGAVYHDYEGEITYSVIVDEDNPRIPRDILKSYEIICNGIILGLGKMGMKAKFKPINDIVVNGRKISGNAQTRRRGVVVQHGTILVKTDVKTMFDVLRVTKEKISDKMIKTVEDRVTSIERETNRKADFNETYKALRDGFSATLDVELEIGELNGEEQELMEKLREKKYKVREWIFSQPKAASFESI